MSDPQSEFVEQYAPRGPQGPRGEQGGKGDPGNTELPRRARRSLVGRDVVIIVLLLLNFLFTAKYENHSQAAERAQGVKVERAICGTLAKLAGNRPPAGNPATNPSRGYDQRNHAILDELGPDLGCR